MTTGTTIGTPTPDGAGWLALLETAGAEQTAGTVRAALESAFEQRTPLACRVAFGKLNQKVKPTPLPGAVGASEPPDAALESELLEDIAARIAFVVGLAERLPPQDFRDILTTLYRTGSDREQIGILRALPFLPDQENLVPLAREASRTNDVAVFSALACRNAFPARCLPDAAFEQLILKALFLGVSLERVQELQARITPELERMVADFAAERRAAGRPVPGDVALILEYRSRAPNTAPSRSAADMP